MSRGRWGAVGAELEDVPPQDLAVARDHEHLGLEAREGLEEGRILRGCGLHHRDARLVGHLRERGAHHGAARPRSRSGGVTRRARGARSTEPLEDRRREGRGSRKTRRMGAEVTREGRQRATPLQRGRAQARSTRQERGRSSRRGSRGVDQPRCGSILALMACSGWLPMMVSWTSPPLMSRKVGMETIP